MNFELTTDQRFKATTWISDHRCDERGFRNITYSFTCTGIGIAEKVSCGCGEVLDLTNYGAW